MCVAGTPSGVPIFASCEEMVANKEAMDHTDGVIICTAHSCHMDMGMQFLKAGSEHSRRYLQLPRALRAGHRDPREAR